MLLKNPSFTLIAVLTLGLGIGANTAIFSVVNAVLLRPLPYPYPEQLMRLSQRGREGRRMPASYPNFADWRVRARSFEGMAAVRGESFNLTGTDKPLRLRGRFVSWNFFQILGAGPQLGRSFTEEDDRYGAARTVLLDDRLWKDRFGGDPTILGKPILLDGESYAVIGILPPGFEYIRREDVYVPIGLELRPQTGMTDRGTSIGGMHAVARLKPGVTSEQANSEMEKLGMQLELEYPATNSGRSAMAEPLQEVMTENIRRSLWVLLSAVGFILLIACVNVAHFLLVRAAEREKEIALRLALGAGRRRIIAQLLVESLLTTLLAGAGALLLGGWMLEGLLALVPQGIPQINHVGMDRTVLLFTLGVAVLTSLLCGLLPALHASRVDLNTALKEGGRSTAGSAREGIRKSLVVVEVGLALVLLAGAGLLLRSMYNVLHVDPGFNADDLLTMRIELRGERYGDQGRRAFYDECLARVKAVPGVRSAGLTHSLPIAGTSWNQLFIAADKPVPQRVDLPHASLTPVSADYFETMGIRLLKGRRFTAADAADSATVAVINESLARRIWPNEDPLGKRLRLGRPEMQAPWREVIGVVNDVKLDGLELATPMEVYLPLAQEPVSSVNLAVRTSSVPAVVAGAIERAIHSVDGELPVASILTMDQLLGNSMAYRRLISILLASFAVSALLLAALGIYGVIAHSVRRRTHEIGVRIALGAQSGDVLRLVIGQGMALTLIGMVIGLIAAVGLTRLIRNLLFGMDATDPVTFAVIVILLAGVALLACYIPARRATKVDPMVALRCE
jgi:putative ABC transport system permease protein